MKAAPKDKRLGIISIAMIPVSIIGTLAFHLIFLSAPIGIVCGIIAAKRKNKALGVTGAVINAVLIVGLLTLWILAATSKTD